MPVVPGQTAGGLLMQTVAGAAPMDLDTPGGYRPPQGVTQGVPRDSHAVIPIMSAMAP